MALNEKLRKRLTNAAATGKSTTDKYVMPGSDAEPEQLIAWLDKHRESGKKRMPDLQMKMNLAYTLGHQWIVWDRDRRQFRRPQWRPNDPNAPVRITINKIGGIVERTIARLLKEAPDPECRPTSDDEDDVGAARVGSRILDHEMDRTKWDVKLVDLYFWVTVLGWSFLHIYWDASQGTMVGQLPLGEEADAETMPVHQGEVSIEVVPAFELGVDPNARKMEDALWCIRTVSLTKEATWEKFGVMPVTTMPGRTLVDEVYALTDTSREEKAAVDTIAVHQMWIKPGTRMAPKGAVITWAGSTVLEKKDFPYDHNQLPFIQFDLLPGMGTREGRTWVNDLIPIQADYNDARSREAMIRRSLAPKILYPIGSMDMQRMTTRVEGIPYTPTGNPPTLMMPDGRWMQAPETTMNRANGELGERAGQADVSSGDAPASMPAASVMALQEADDTKLAISMKQLSKGISQTGWQWLMLVKQFWQEPRIVRTWSQEGDIEVDDFLGSDLGNTLDVHVDAESSLPKSKTARMNLLMELVQIPGMFTDPRDFLKQLDLPGISPLLATLSIDNKQAERENAKLLDGIQIPVNDFDNHPVHLQEHADCCKTEDYSKIMDAARTGDQQALQVIATMDAHRAAHQEAIIAAQQMGPTLPGQTPPDAAGGGQVHPGYMNNPSTGMPSDPAAVAAGQQPQSAMSESAIHQGAGIGGPNEPGAVPGVPADTQAHRMGS
jgi:hypothetical protein